MKKILALLAVILCLAMLSSCLFEIAVTKTVVDAFVFANELKRAADGTYEEIEEADLPKSNIQVIDRTRAFASAKSFPQFEDARYHLPEKKTADQERRYYGTGNCETLSGNFTVALFFVGDDESDWSEDEVEEYTEATVLPALEFVKKQADSWGVEVDFSVWRFASCFDPELDLQYDGVVYHSDSEGGSSEDVMERMSESFGYEYELGLYRALEASRQDFGVIPFFILDKTGRSCAFTYASVSGVYGSEYALLFSERTDGRDPTPATFAHELLHLFGAEDMYIPNERAALARRLYSEDIMYMKTTDIKRMNVGEFTAYALGWTDKAPQVCQNEQWYENYEGYEDYRAREDK